MPPKHLTQPGTHAQLSKPEFKRMLRLFAPPNQRTIHDVEYYRVVPQLRQYGKLAGRTPKDIKALRPSFKRHGYESLLPTDYWGIAVVILVDGSAYYYISKHATNSKRPYSRKVAHTVAVGRALSIAAGRPIHDKHGCSLNCEAYRLSHISAPTSADLRDADNNLLTGVELRKATLQLLVANLIVLREEAVPGITTIISSLRRRALPAPQGK